MSRLLFVRPESTKKSTKASYVMRADLKYARAVRGMEHVEAPIPEESFKKEPIKAF